MVIAKVIAMILLELALVQSEDVVEDIEAVKTNSALGNAVLPGARDRGLRGFQVHGSQGTRGFQPAPLVVVKKEEQLSDNRKNSYEGIISTKADFEYRKFAGQSLGSKLIEL